MTLFGKAKMLLGYVAAISALTYAIGYSVNIAHFKMLGVASQVELSNEEVIYDGAVFWFATLISWIASPFGLPRAFSVLSLIVWLVLLGWFFGARWWQRQRSRGGWAARCWAWCERKCWPFAPLLVLTALVIFSMIMSKAAMSQRDLLVGGAGPTRDKNAFLAWLTGCDGGLSQVLSEDVSCKGLYGTVSLLTAACAVSWCWLLRRRIPDRRSTESAPRTGRRTQFLLAVSGMALLLQLLLVVFLYGFLMVSNEYPVIEVREDPMEKPGVASAPACRPNRDRTEPFDRTLVVIGQRGATVVVYETGRRRLWWIDRSRMPLAVQTKRCNVFEYVYAPCEGADQQ